MGRHGIVAFPNFGHWTTRLSHLLSGRSPKTELFPHDWYESPNLHFLTIDDFVLLCRAQNWVIERQIFLRSSQRVTRMPNLLAEVGVFSIRREGTPPSRAITDAGRISLPETKPH